MEVLNVNLFRVAILDILLPLLQPLYILIDMVVITIEGFEGYFFVEVVAEGALLIE